MSDFTIPEETDEDSDQFRQLRDHAKKLEADLKASNKNAVDSALVVKENAFLKAGIDVKDPVAAMLLSSYDGELDEQAILTAAAAVRLTPGEPAASSTPTEPAVLGDPAMTGERNALANDSGGSTQLPAEDPIQAGYKDFYDGLARGQSREDAAPAVLGRMIAAGNAGDPRFRFDPQEWTNQAEAKSR